MFFLCPVLVLLSLSVPICSLSLSSHMEWCLLFLIFVMCIYYTLFIRLSFPYEYVLLIKFVHTSSQNILIPFTQNYSHEKHLK